MLVNLNDILYKARENHYGVGLFNTTDSDAIEAVISAAEELRSPVIIGTAEVLLSYGELQLLAPTMVTLAKKATVPVAVHLDHGLTFERCMEALKLGFTSIMFDGSAGDHMENLRQTAEIVKVAHAFGATVEGEIGHVGETDTGDNNNADLYTTCEEAYEFAQKTGVDALAISIGTAHGAYKSKPKLDLDRLKQIRKKVDIPLVLHGGSGLSDEDFKNTITNGIAKVNIFTDLYVAALSAMRQNIDKTYPEIRNAKVEAMKQAAMTKMRLFGSENRYQR